MGVQGVSLLVPSAELQGPIGHDHKSLLARLESKLAQKVGRLDFVQHREWPGPQNHRVRAHDHQDASSEYRLPR